MLKTDGKKRADFSGREPGINVPAPRMLKTDGKKRADFSGREPGINVPAPRTLKNKRFSPSV
jgi:hypothetical protein